MSIALTFLVISGIYFFLILLFKTLIFRSITTPTNNATVTHTFITIHMNGMHCLCQYNHSVNIFQSYIFLAIYGKKVTQQCLNDLFSKRSPNYRFAPCRSVFMGKITLVLKFLFNLHVVFKKHAGHFLSKLPYKNVLK